MSLFKALGYRPFALLWSGQTISRLGDSLYTVALTWWVLEQTRSGLVMGTVLIFRTVPLLLFLLVGGVMVDRFPRLQLMFISDLIRGLALGLIALLAFNNLLEIWHIYLVSMVFGFVSAFFEPAYRAAVADLLSAETLNSANSLTSLSNELSGIVGPGIAAGLVALGGTSFGFSLDAVSFGISAICLLPILKLSTTPGKAKPGVLNMVGELRTGISTVFASPWLWVTIGVAALTNITYAGPMGVALPFLIKDQLHLGVDTLGLFYSLSSVGAVVGAVWLSRYSKIRQRGLVLYGVWVLIGLMVCAIGLPITLYGILVASFVIGLCDTILSLVWVNTLQELVPHELQGRVNSIDYLGSYIFLPIGYSVGGWATDSFEPSLIFIIGGLLSAGLVALGLLHPDVRHLD